MRKVGAWKIGLVASLLTAVCVVIAQDNEFFRILSQSETIITRIYPDGRIIWTNAVLGATGRVQRASSLSGGGDWADAHQFLASTSWMTATVSRNYLVIDLSAGSTASSYPMQYLSGPPEGGWSDEYKSTKLVLRRIPAGSFEMGSPVVELGHEAGEILHDVTLTKDVFIGVFPVTQKQWERVMNAWPAHFANVSVRETRPVESVSYDMIRGSVAGANWPTDAVVDADSFLGRLRARTGQAFELPTESQWEYAARAGSVHALHSGQDLLGLDESTNLNALARYQYNHPGGFSVDAQVDASGGTAPVGVYTPNAWGLYDIHGSVSEWCLDWKGDYPGDPVSDPQGAVTGAYRVVRGGALDAPASACRLACRTADREPTYADLNTGFRLALALEANGDVTYLVTHEAGPGGTISGPTSQTVLHGASGQTVEAVPDTGYRFVQWSDGDTNAVRNYANLTGPVSVTAEFEMDLMKAALESAIADIEVDLGWIFDTQNGIQRYIDTPMAPTWTAKASAGTSNFVHLAVGPALEHIPGIAQTAPDGVTNLVNRPVWKNIESGGQIIGRQAYLIVDCSGLLDVTAIGKKERAPFENDSRGIPLTPELLSEFPDAASVEAFKTILNNRTEPIQSLPELRQVMAEAGAGEPLLAFFTSYSPPNEWYDQYHQMVRPRIEFGTNYASVVANREAIKAGWQQIDEFLRNTPASDYWDVEGPRTILDFRADGSTADRFNLLFSCLEDYLDTDAIPKDIRSINNETTPQISEIIFSNRISSAVVSGATGNWTNALTVWVEVAFPHPVSGVNRDYDLEVDIKGSGNLLINATNMVIALDSEGPRDPGYPASATWLPNEYRVWVNQFSQRYEAQLSTVPRRRPTYTVTVRIRDRASGELVDIAESISIDSRDIIQGDGNTWAGTLWLPMDESGVSSKTPLTANYPEVCNWGDVNYSIRKDSNGPIVAETSSNQVTCGFYNVQAFSPLSIYAGMFIPKWLAYSRSQDQLDHVSEIFRIPGLKYSDTSVGLYDFFAAADYRQTISSGIGRYRDIQYFDRLTTSTNLPFNGYINPNSCYSNVLAHAYINLPYQWYAGIDGYLKKAINPIWNDGLEGPQDYRFDLEPRGFNALTALNFGRKQMLNRDVVFPAPLNGPRQRTTYQYMGWYDSVVLNEMKHYEKFGVWPLPGHIYGSSIFPNRTSVSEQCIDLGPEWQTGSWPNDRELSYPSPSQGTLPAVIQPLLGYEINALGYEYIHQQTLRGQFCELMNPRQNLFTVILATQEIAPKPLGTVITEDDVISEERSVRILWRDPWPTAPDGETDSPDFDKARRVHKIRILHENPMP